MNLSGDKQSWWHAAFEIFIRLSGWVLIPLIVGYTLGRWLDARYDSNPKWFLISTGIAFVISMTGLVIQAKSEYKKIDPPNK